MNLHTIASVARQLGVSYQRVAAAVREIGVGQVLGKSKVFTDAEVSQIQASINTRLARSSWAHLVRKEG